MLSENIAYIHLKEYDDQVKDKVTELQIVTENVLKKNQKVDSIEPIVQLLHDNIREIQVEKDKILERFTLLRTHLFPQITLLENELQECLSTKSSYEKFMAIDLNIVELVAYALCALIIVSDALKDSWKNKIEQLKTTFNDCISKF